MKYQKLLCQQLTVVGRTNSPNFFIYTQPKAACSIFQILTIKKNMKIIMMQGKKLQNYFLYKIVKALLISTFDKIHWKFYLRKILVSYKRPGPS